MGPQLVLVIPTYKAMDPVGNPDGYFWHLISRIYFQSRISPRFCFKIPNPELQVRNIPNPEKPTGVHQILKTPNIIRYLALRIDCVLLVYLFIKRHQIFRN